jgi:hypothetical protein
LGTLVILHGKGTNFFRNNKEKGENIIMAKDFED